MDIQKLMQTLTPDAIKKLQTQAPAQVVADPGNLKCNNFYIDRKASVFFAAFLIAYTSSLVSFSKTGDTIGASARSAYFAFNVISFILFTAFAGMARVYRGKQAAGFLVLWLGWIGVLAGQSQYVQEESSRDSAGYNVFMATQSFVFIIAVILVVQLFFICKTV